jgi:hypothetical protein
VIPRDAYDSDVVKLDFSIAVSSTRAERRETEAALSAALKARSRTFTWTTD